MKLSLSARILDGASPMASIDFVRTARRAGYEMVELRPAQASPDHTDAELAALKAALDETGLSVSMLVAGPAPEIGNWIRVARALGATILRTSGSPAAVLAACGQLDEGMRLVCQMHAGSPFEDVAAAAAALRDIPDPRFGVMPEPANLRFAGESWRPDVLAPLRGRLYGCNAQSIVRSPGSPAVVRMNDGCECPYTRVDWPDNRDIDLPGFVAALRAVGYDDFINFIDPYRQGMTVLDLAAQTAAYARRVVG